MGRFLAAAAISTRELSSVYPGLFIKAADNFIKKHSIYYLGSFYPPGEPISSHLLRCGRLAVVYYGFTYQHLANGRTWPVNYPVSILDYS
jgi:hypothetical protein